MAHKIPDKPLLSLHKLYPAEFPENDPSFLEVSSYGAYAHISNGEGGFDIYQYNPNICEWNYLKVANIDVDWMATFGELIVGYNQVGALFEDPHFTLGACGALDISIWLAMGCDFLDGALYYLEGDKVSATLSMAAVLPLGSIIVAGRKVVKFAHKKLVIKVGDGIKEFDLTNLEKFMGELNLTEGQVDKLGEIFSKRSKDFAPSAAYKAFTKAALEDNYIIAAWKYLDDVEDLTTLKALAADLKANDKLFDFFDGNAGGVKAWKGLFGHQTFRTNTVDLETVANYYTRTGKSVDDFVDELFADPALIRNWLDDLANSIYRFTLKQVDDYVVLATKQGNQSKVMLGMWDGGGANSYIAKAGNNHTYFDMGTTKWDEAKDLVSGGSNDWVDEMWEINKKFIDDQHAGSKDFWFSHDPYSPLNDQFYAREVNYLIDLGVQNFEQVGDLWKAVW